MTERDSAEPWQRVPIDIDAVVRQMTRTTPPPRTPDDRATEAKMRRALDITRPVASVLLDVARTATMAGYLPEVILSFDTASALDPARAAVPRTFCLPSLSESDLERLRDRLRKAIVFAVAGAVATFEPATSSEGA